MERGKKILFVSHCILNQNARAIGRERYSGCVKELVDLFSEAGVGIVQIPCPQMEFNGGLDREPETRQQFDREIYRDFCRKLSKKILNEIEKYLSKNYNILGILGVDMSPICAVNRVENRKKTIPGKGIFIEELEKEMQTKNFQVPLLGANLNNIYNTLERVGSLLKNC